MISVLFFSHLIFFQSVADLTTCVVPVVMSGNFKWKLEPWHVKFGLISQGIFTDEESIQIPETQISGPNPTLEGKEFLVTVKVSNCIFFFVFL